MVLPNSIFGYDTDDIFGHQTQKLTYIRDRWLGVFFYLLVSLVSCWVFFGQILWRNEHFQLKDVNGVARMWFSHPTKGLCDPDEWDCKPDFTPLEQLPYCQQGSGPKSDNAARCSYEDKFSALVNPNNNDRIFIPTSSVTFTEHLNCDAQDPNCKQIYKREQTAYYYDPSFITYFADIERFRLQMTQSYERDGIAGTSLEHQGHVEECEIEQPPTRERQWPERVSKRRDGCSKRGGSKRTVIGCGEGMSCSLEKVEAPDLVADIPGADVAESVTFHHMASEQSVQAAKYRMKIAQSAPSHPVFNGYASKSPTLMLNRRHGDRAPRRHQIPDMTLLSTGENQTHNRVDSTASDQSLKLESKVAQQMRSSHRASASLRTASRAAHATAKGVGERALKTQPAENVPRNSGLYMSPWGDTFLLGKLLAIAGVQLDHDYNGDGLTVRQSGTIIEIEAEYNNMYRFASSLGYQPVEYTYHVNELAVPYMNREFFAADQPENYPNSRNIVNEHGILVVLKISGQFGFFNIVSLLLMLTIAGAMLGSATRMTDLAAIYLHPRRRNYFHLKYELSPDFSDMWQCHVCQFWNEKNETVCSGIDKWESPKDKDPCNTPKKGAWQCDGCELYNDQFETECQHYDHREHKCRAHAPPEYEHRVRARSTSS